MNATTWRGILNGEALGGYPPIGQAKERVDWEVWNSVRQMAAGYKRLLERHVEWHSGGN